MLKFILILALAFLGNIVKNSREVIILENLPSMEFSNPALDFESGQPVFSKETSAILKIRKSGDVKIFINDVVETQATDSQIDLSSLIEFSEGTYTVLVQGENYEEAFGFTIR